MNFHIKIGVPSRDEVQAWGDYHFAKAMQKALSRIGHNVAIQILPEWNDESDKDSDVTIHLMGLSRYNVKKGPLNVLWIISHPDKIPRIDFSQYDLILAASRPLTEKLNRYQGVPAMELLQFADTYNMFPNHVDGQKHELLFVGNSRGENRKIIKDLIPSEHSLNIWGGGWEAFLPPGYLKGTYFPYSRLRQLYSSSTIVLNDHWEDMRKWGIVNNRIFDALACKAFIVSDTNPEISRIFQDTVVCYRERSDLLENIRYYIAHPDEMIEKREQGYQLVKKHHSVDMRMQEMLEMLHQPRRRKFVTHLLWKTNRHLFKSKKF